MSAIADSVREDATRPPSSEADAASSSRRVRREQAKRKRAHRRATFVGVIGELLLTGGVIVLLFIGWQLWLSEILIGNEMREEAAAQTAEWNRQAAENPIVLPEPTEDPADPETPVADDPWIEPPVASGASYGKDFGMLIVPRWGADYYRKIAEGTGADVLDRGRLGRYTNTQMPGEIGNFAIAAHRMGKGGSLHYIDELQLGDRIYVETAEGWYQYSFRNLEYVRPSGVGVLNPIPQVDAAPQGERFITLTSCNPEHTTAERIIAYGTFDRFHPRNPSAPDNGAPDEIAATVNQ